ncbi:MAG: ABC transporter ATP-binding protein [Planctomycetaceae bacterium]
MIEFDHVWRDYGRKTAVRDLTLAIPRGELFALLGPNGAGKTTTIRMLVGLLRPSRGVVRVATHDVVRSPRDAHLLVGYVPDEPCLYDKLTGREFLWFIADMFGLPRSVSRERIDREIGTFELGEFVDDLAESYSLGMKQRLVFAAALVHDPAVLVLDEPMVGLDPRSARIVKDMLASRTHEGMTVFMSTHLLTLAEEMADRVGIMVQGSLRFLGTLGELRDQMAADRIGDASRIPGENNPVSSTRSASLEHLYLQLTSESPGPPGGGRTSGVRPDDLDPTRSA